MCGFVGILLKVPDGTAPSLQALDSAPRLTELPPWDTSATGDVLHRLERLSYELVGWPGYRLLRDQGYSARLEEAVALLNRTSGAWERALAEGPESDGDVEAGNTSLVKLKDLLWRFREDALNNLAGVDSLHNPDCSGSGSDEHLHALWQLNFLLKAIDRLEVRGRDSAGLSCLLTFPSRTAWETYWTKLEQVVLHHEAEQRIGASFVSGALRVSPQTSSVVFTFKVAAEVGEMGQNVKELRAKIVADRLFQETIATPGVRTNLFAHTRWASNGVINEANCHPVSDDVHDLPGKREAILSSAVNGDIDNYQELKQHIELAGSTISPTETTDAKVIPLVTRQNMERGESLKHAYLHAVGETEGSFAAVLHGTTEPDQVLLAKRGGGQSVYVGRIPGGYAYASEVYGIVELCNEYVTMEGEDGYEALVLTRGQPSWEKIEIHRNGAPPTPLPVTRVCRAEITTRDIDRAGFPHFLLKEICEAPMSTVKTLRGKFTVDDRGHRFHLSDDVVPEGLAAGLRDQTVRRVFVVGQGTAAVAGDGIASCLSEVLGPRGIDVRSCKASELSGFRLSPKMDDTLVIAVSQSGTTTDTNRTVDMVRERGAWVLGVINRRDSSLVEKVHGVFYTSDGRDVEMAVASTKAFYAQVVAGQLLALYLGETLGTLQPSAVRRRLEELRSLPAKMQRVLGTRDSIAQAARRWAPTRCHWAVVGSGPNRVAAEEIRIKLSELCYKSIASDHTEDKKHIDLSSEPLVLICTVGLEGTALDDLVKEVAIFKAHRACPIVLAAQGEERFLPYANETIVLPAASPREALLLNTLAGHLWGYYSAVAQDEGAELLRSLRKEIVLALQECEELPLHEDGAIVEHLLGRVKGNARRCLDELRQGRFNSSLSAATASRVSTILHHLSGGVLWMEAERELGSPATLSQMLGRMVAELTAGIEETTRPIDAIKHQAKTVTVGISRLESKPQGVLFDYLDQVGVPLEQVTYSSQLLLRLLGGLVDDVRGSTHYALEGLNELGEPVPQSRLAVARRFGISQNMRSRADGGSALQGTKRWVVANRVLFAGVGGRDGRFIAIIPLLMEGQPRELVLLHLRLRGDAPLREKLWFLKQYRGRLEAIRDATTELDVQWSDDLLEPFTPEEILSLRPEEVAGRIRDAVAKRNVRAGRATGKRGKSLC